MLHISSILQNLMIIISPKKVACRILLLGFALDFLSLITTLPNVVLGRKIIPGTIHNLFYVDIEYNLPSWFSALILVFCGISLWLIAKDKQAKQGSFLRHWQILSGIFVFLAIDESVGIHDVILSTHLEQLLKTSGLFYFAWVIVAIPLCLLLLLSYWKFLLHLPRRIRHLFILAGSLYIGAAVGIEMFNGAISEKFGEAGLAYILPTSIEECLEKIGIAIFAYALLLYLQSRSVEIHFSLPNTLRTTDYQ